MIVTKIRGFSIVLWLLTILILVYPLVLNIVSLLPGHHITSTPPLLGTRSAFDDVNTVSNWTTYTDLRFSIQYPSSWFVDPEGPGRAFIFTTWAHSPEEAEEALPAIWLY